MGVLFVVYILNCGWTEQFFVCGVAKPWIASYQSTGFSRAVSASLEAGFSR
jgi:hypothetical protein